MEITVDTSKDSHEHIRKVIDLLRTIVGEQSISISSPSSAPSNTFDTPAGNVFEGMFGDSSPAQELPSKPVQMDIPPSDQTQPQAVDIWGNPKKPDPDVEVY